MIVPLFCPCAAIWLAASSSTRARHGAELALLSANKDKERPDRRQALLRAARPDQSCPNEYHDSGDRGTVYLGTSPHPRNNKQIEENFHSFLFIDETRTVTRTLILSELDSAGCSSSQPWCGGSSTFRALNLANYEVVSHFRGSFLSMHQQTIRKPLVSNEKPVTKIKRQRKKK